MGTERDTFLVGIIYTDAIRTNRFENLGKTLYSKLTTLAESFDYIGTTTPYKDDSPCSPKPGPRTWKEVSVL